MEAEVLLIDRGSSESPQIQTPNTSKIKLPRTSFEYERRVALIHNLQNALLLKNDVFIYTDCDELLVSTTENSLAEEIEKIRHLDLVSPIGINLI